MPQLDVLTYPAQVFWLFITFIGLYLFVATYFIPAISSIAKLRADKLSKELASAEVFLGKYKALKSDVESILNEAKATAHQIRLDSSIESQDLVDQEIERCDKKINADFLVEERRLDAFRIEFKAALPGIVEDLSCEIFNVVLNTYNNPKKLN